MAERVGFVVNPIAGLGGRVGLKGTDDVVELALARGAVPRAGERAVEMLEVLREGLLRASPPQQVHWLTCAGPMGADALRDAGFEAFEIVYSPSERPTEEDTRRAVRAFLDAEASIVLFGGGDGTARAVCAETRRRVPILGIPAGVKMYSAVFGISPARTAEILLQHLAGHLGLADAEVLDVDEERFRAGQLDVRLYDSALTPHEPTLVQSAKQVFSDPDEGHAKAEIAEEIAEWMQREPETLFLLGPGSTVASVAERNELTKSLLGVDAVKAGAVVGKDLDESELLALLDESEAVRLVVSPIGAQGFVLGRGNQQLSPTVIRRIGRDRIVVVATPMKLAGTAALRFDTGDRELDHVLAGEGFLPVLTGYHVRRLVAVEI